MSTERLHVDLSGRAYDIIVGASVLEAAGSEISKLKKARRAFVVTDENVARLHLPTLKKSLDQASISHTAVILPPGEASKSFAMLEHVVTRMLEANLERTDLVLALGGGVIGDLAGFAAGIAKRGLDYVQLPTTLLSQVDSSVGGKTAIDTPQGKNLVGLFHQPILVLADTAVLGTLPAREMRSGYAEILKYGLISDAKFADWLTQNVDQILQAPGAERTRSIVTSCEMKARVVEADEREQGQRALLNLGHTFGHAIEACMNYSGRILHGEAIAVGFIMAFELSERLKLCPQGRADRVREMVARAKLPTSIAELPELGAGPEDLIQLMLQDKKAKDGRLTLILAHDIGQAFVAQDVDAQAIHALYKDALSQPRL
ncbi:MAG: 3-dehydroquinate synthase [Micropepsaceae bacterium]